jgi:protein-tyrosine phosphatase
MSTVAASRVIPLDAVHNFRDLGGYPTADGRITRWRRLFRADGLYRLTAADLEVVRELGIHTVLDLRTGLELEERGRFPVEAHPVAFHHLPMIDVTWDPTRLDEASPPADFLFTMYLEMLTTAEYRLAEAFQLLALPGALPAVFHCAAGKDRTGILAGLVLSSLGVSDADVVADYALTAAAMERFMTWLEQANPEWLEQINSRPSAFMAAEPGAMAALLQLIRREHGSTREYLRGLGVSSVVLATLEDELLEPA